MNRTDIPRPIYAAAGAGELAYEKLRQTAGELRQRYAAAREGDRNEELNARLARVRESAQRGTAVFAARAAAAQERAVTGYHTLVARGERVMADRLGVTTGRTEPGGVEVEVGEVRAAERPGTGRPRTEA